VKLKMSAAVPRLAVSTTAAHCASLGKRVMTATRYSDRAVTMIAPEYSAIISTPPSIIHPASWISAHIGLASGVKSPK